MLEHYFAALLAEITFFLVLLLTGLILYHRAHRRKLLKFFGILNRKTVRVYTSNVHVIRGGSIGQYGVQRAYTGPATPYLESKQAHRFRDLFNFLIPHLSDQPGFLRNLLFSDVQVEVIEPPSDPKEIDPSSTIISTGSPGYNPVSEWIQKNLKPIAEFDHGNGSIELDNLQSITNPYQGFVQRVRDKNHNRTVFYAAGLNEPATVGAIAYLQNNWKELQTRHGDQKDFCLLIQINPKNHNDATIVVERSRTQTVFYSSKPLKA